MRDQDPHEPIEAPDLLRQYERCVSRARTRNVTLGVVIGVAAVVAAMFEPSYFGTFWIARVLLAIFGLLAGIGLLLGFSFVAFFLSWSYARSCKRGGQTRASALQVASVLFLSGLAMIPVAGAFAREGTEAWLGWALLAVVCVNVSAAFLGYVACFFFSGRDAD